MKISKQYQILRFIFLVIFIISCVVLLVEAFTPGAKSADKSNVVSDTIANVINNVSEAITKQPKITNMEEFRALIRKLVGHYGAFLFMGIFAALTFMMYFRYNKWWVFWVKTGALITYGFGFAALTEAAQLITPGRAGVFSDVLIDFSGFMTSVGIIVIIFFFIYYKKLRKDFNETINNSNILLKSSDEIEEENH